jgi:hypothetical protein
MFMKKISLLTLAVVAGFTVMAQEQGRQQEGNKDFKPLRTPMAVKTRFGVIAGINSATYNDNDMPAGQNYSVDSKTSMHIGAFVNIPFGGTFRFQPGLVYNGLGSKVGQYPRRLTGTGFAGTYDNFEEDLHYLSVPLLLQMQSKSGIFVEAGPQIGFLLSAKQDGPGDDEYDIKAGYDKMDVGASVGLGYLTRIGLGFKAGYYFGLANIIEDGGGNNSSNNGPELKNRALQFSLVYHFGAAK